MRKTRSRKRTNKKRIHKRSTRSSRRLRSIHSMRSTRRGGSITTPMVGTLDGEDHKGLGKIVIAGPMGVMSGKAYLQSMENLDQQGAE